MTFDFTNERNAFLDSTPVDDAVFNVCSCSQENYDLSNWGEPSYCEMPASDSPTCEIPQNPPCACDTEKQPETENLPVIEPQNPIEDDSDYEDDIIQL